MATQSVHGNGEGPEPSPGPTLSPPRTTLYLIQGTQAIWPVCTSVHKHTGTYMPTRMRRRARTDTARTYGPACAGCLPEAYQPVHGEAPEKPSLPPAALALPGLPSLTQRCPGVDGAGGLVPRLLSSSSYHHYPVSRLAPCFIVYLLYLVLLGSKPRDRC